MDGFDEDDFFSSFILPPHPLDVASLLGELFDVDRESSRQDAPRSIGASSHELGYGTLLATDSGGGFLVNEWLSFSENAGDITSTYESASGSVLQPELGLNTDANVRSSPSPQKQTRLQIPRLRESAEDREGDSFRLDHLTNDGNDIEPIEPTMTDTIGQQKRRYAGSESTNSEVTGVRAKNGRRAKKRKGRRKITSKEDNAILMAWLEKNRLNPYPDKDEVVNLSRSTDLTPGKIRNWFSNARIRHLPKIISAVLETPKISPEAQPKLVSGDGDDLVMAQPPGDSASAGINDSMLSSELSPPMVEYLAQPPENDPIPLDAVEKAAASPEYAELLGKWPYLENGVDDYYPGSGRRCHSAASSFGSACSGASFTSQSYQYPRKGRRKVAETAKAVLPGENDSSLKTSQVLYQCTFCGEEFGRQYTWKRHEKLQHVPGEEWVCMPRGPRDGAADPGRCIFCNAPDASDEHLATEHNAFTCHNKDIRERTFTRNYGLKQHLKQVHRCNNPSPEMLRTWSLEILYDADWGCEFCNRTFSKWDERTKHVASHFRGGCRLGSSRKLKDPVRQLSGVISTGRRSTIGNTSNQTMSNAERNEFSPDAVQYHREEAVQAPTRPETTSGDLTPFLFEDVTFLPEEPNINPNSRDLPDLPPLFEAFGQHGLALIRHLLCRRDVDFNARNGDGDTCLHLAARDVDTARLNLLLKRGDLDVNARDAHGRTALHITAIHHRKSTMPVQLTSPFITDDDKLSAALQQLESEADIANSLLLSGHSISPYIRDNSGHTALFHAVVSGKSSIARTMLDHGIQPDYYEFGDGARSKPQAVTELNKIQAQRLVDLGWDRGLEDFRASVN